jgi:hypothetical protein
VDPLELSVERFVNLVYYWATRSMKQEDRDKFDATLIQPVGGTASAQVRQATGRWSREDELMQFKRATG